MLSAGLVHQLNGGVLILSASNLLERFDLWHRLKQILTTKQFDWYSLNPLKIMPCDIPSYPVELKIILLANRAELATLDELDEDILQIADYAEIESYFSMENCEKQIKWASFVQQYARQNGFPAIKESGLTALYQYLARQSEDRHLINISPLKLKSILSGVVACNKNYNQSNSLSAVDFLRYFDSLSQQQGFLRECAYNEILKEQIYVATQGEIVGQINGLSVIEYAGSPASFGEPSRISCIVQFGEGEIIDVERKNELAGNIHGKGIMIAELCLANILELPSQLPFSASIVFEQSYSEIDGDSASLASFCVLVSALANLPLPQSIAVTGAIDQFGLVHSVGGVNEKIEGFFTICERRGLTGHQGVIIPTTVLNQLSLSETVVSAVKNGKFSIWTVDDVFQACQILFKRPLLSDDKNTEETSISTLINHRVQHRAEPKIRLFERLFFKR